MARSPGVDHCTCGALAGPLGLCMDYYHALLAEEQTDACMYRWHAPVICAYLLQHPDRADATYLDGQFRMLQLYLDQGLDTLLRVTARQAELNRHGRRTGYDMESLAPYAPLPSGGPPEHFDSAFSGLPVTHGSFVFDGYEAYGQRIESIAAATVDAWNAVQN
ncbi:hypothetical protein EF847_21325 [Actinobacteria bacterium YIM 96077]|uniref:Uncharacterized protein n=1 Tax=Phytoactinopolyspora halophila TaxID=1981511 RepID=A0A329QLU8_9ACTN|nr:DUF5946 family protein [Phytoactinopolyspora halophila]AYY14852.1 hypothetical protein EF847_21325 [Actinobacteria bacterium YIM 96077]RAW13126.1 hypothetical protein DPM12_13735 [Phytoactinopolyspora halophila]